MPDSAVIVSHVHLLNMPVLLKLQKTTLLSPPRQFLSGEAAANSNKICLQRSAFQMSDSQVKAAPYGQPSTAVLDCDFCLGECLIATSSAQGRLASP